MIGATRSGGHAEHEYVLLKQIEADKKNAELADVDRDLRAILTVGLERDPSVALGETRSEPTLADLPIELREKPAPERASFEPVPAGLLGALLPGAADRRAKVVKAAEAEFEAALARWREWKSRQDEAMAGLRAEALAHNRGIEALRSALEAGEPEAEKRHAELVLRASPYPKAFPKEVRAEFDPGSRELVVDLRIPTLADVVPLAEQYGYVRRKDRVLASKRPEPERHVLYERIVAQVALRTFHELFSADVGGRVESIKLTLFRTMIDPGTGKTVRSAVLMTRVTRGQFEAIELARVEAVACLRRLAGPDEFPSAPPIEGW
jgi:restriction system protein